MFLFPFAVSYFQCWFPTRSFLGSLCFVWCCPVWTVPNTVVCRVLFLHGCHRGITLRVCIRWELKLPFLGCPPYWHSNDLSHVWNTMGHHGHIHHMWARQSIFLICRACASAKGRSIDGYFWENHTVCTKLYIVLAKFLHSEIIVFIVLGVTNIVLPWMDVQKYSMLLLFTSGRQEVITGPSLKLVLCKPIALKF